MARRVIISFLFALVVVACAIAVVHHFRQEIAAALFPASIPDSPSEAKDKRASSYGREMVLTAASDGHFYLDATVDRSHIRFMVDTGASVTVLNRRDARDLNIDVDRLPATHKVQTGGGPVEMGSVTLPYIESGKIRVNIVDALVTKIDMPYSVLGMNFLRRLRSYSVEGNRMVLVP